MPKTLRASLKWLFPAVLLGALGAMGMACGSSDSGGDSASSGGNGCIPGAQSSCDCPGAAGAGIQVCNQTGTGFEPCDCTNIGNTGSTGTGSTSCGNGIVDDGEECDDGNQDNTDGCNTICTGPSCGNGVVEAGEDCDDGNNSEFDTCPSDCQQGGTGGMGQGGGGTGGSGGDPCAGVVTYAGMIPAGAQTQTPWTFGADQGKVAGDKMCQNQLGAAGICDYEQVKDALAKGELNNDIAIINAGGNGLTAWVHRTTVETINKQLHPDPNGGIVSQPGAGGRCNEWTYTTNHISDGEYAVLTNSGGVTSAQFFIDNDTFYNGMDTTHTVSSDLGDANSNIFGGGASDTLQCNSVQRAILCCYPVCQP